MGDKYLVTAFDPLTGRHKTVYSGRRLWEAFKYYRQARRDYGYRHFQFIWSEE
jgi:hypothetical protein